MNTPLLLTSVAFLAGVAARPINNDRRSEDLRELVQHPDSEARQAFLGHVPSGFDSLNSLQLHDVHDNTHADAEPSGSKSPKLIGADGLSDPDPGLDSPYMGPQRHIASIEQELVSPVLSHDTPAPSSPPTRQTEEPRIVPSAPEYSHTVVILVFSSLAALALLGLTITVVYVTQLLRRTVLREDVWRTVAGEHGGETGDVNWSEKEKLGQRGAGTLVLLEAENADGVIAAREVPRGALSSPLTSELTKPSETSVDDPELMPLPADVPSSSAPAVRDQGRDPNMGLALARWTYDNWVTHFMMALFGWLGVFFGSATDRG